MEGGVRIRGVLAVAALAAMVAGCSTGDGDLLNSLTGSDHSPMQIPAVVRYVHRIAAAAAGVQEDVDAVEAALQTTATMDPTDQTTIAELAQLVQQERNEIVSAGAAFRLPTARGQIGAWEAETVLATKHLAAALGALDSYLADSSTAPTDTRQFATGSSEWDDAVTHLWSAAGLSDPPTLGTPGM
jgi:hypothetical protein